MYSAEEREEILRRARECLEQRDDDSPAQQEDGWPLAPDPLARSSRGLERYKREAEEQAEKFRRAREARVQQERREMHERQAEADAQWEAWLRGHLDAERQLWHDVMAEVIAIERRERRKEFQKAIDDAVADLRKELLTEKRQVLDLPRLPLLRKVKDNAA
jgi:hypothetical protein